MSNHSAFLTNDELAEWVACELRKYEERDRLQGEAAKRGLADGLHRQDAKQLARIKAIIAGQEAILRDLPDVALTGDFRVTPTAYGGWAVRYAVRGPQTLTAAATGFVECIVAANGTVELLRKPA